MDWEIIIEALNSVVREDSLRADLYRYLMLNGFHDEGENFIGQDEVFDEVWDQVAKESQDDDNFIEGISDLFDDEV